tara:strand:- start:367 stop:1482 length:1116 start_codon:yes stop_codon:yes gene_type:complete
MGLRLKIFKFFLIKKRLNFFLLRLNYQVTKIIIGPLFSNLGGVPHHILGLKEYSCFNITTCPDYKTLALINKNKNDLVAYYKSKLNSHKIKSNIIHSHVDPWFIDLCKESRCKGSKWVHTYHTLYFEKDWDKGLEPWQEEVNDALINRAIHADIKISIAHWLKNYLKTYHNIDTIYLPNGVDVKKCDASLGTRFTSKYGLKDFILFASGISDIKNAGDFLKLAQSLPDKTFVIIGRGITEEKLKHKFKIDLGTNIHVFGTMPHDQLLDAIAACKVFVVTSRSEGLPTVLMEAMTLERSVVGVNTYGTKEVIHSDKFGYLYAHDNFDDLVAKTKLAFDVSKGVKARERILEHYDWKVIAPKIDTVYKYLLNE